MRQGTAEDDLIVQAATCHLGEDRNYYYCLCQSFYKVLGKLLKLILSQVAVEFSFAFF